MVEKQSIVTRALLSLTDKAWFHRDERETELRPVELVGRWL